MTVTEILTSARAKIERGWCQNTLARNVQGKPVDMRSENACAFCALGAIASVAVNNVQTEVAASVLTRVVGGNISGWNDSRLRTKEQVLDGFSAAILKAERMEKT